MAVKYVCSECGRKWDADEYREDLNCPECNARLVTEDKAKGAAAPAAQKPVNPAIPNSPPAFKGLKVARPVAGLGGRRPPVAAPAAPAAPATEARMSETQSVPAAALPSAEFAAQMETLYAKRQEQAEEAARLLVERAELEAERRRRELIDRAEKEAKERAKVHLAELQADLNAQIETIRASRQREAEQQAEALIAKARESAKAIAQRQIEESLGEARRQLDQAVAENEAREKKLREAAEKLKSKHSELAELETALKEQTRKNEEAQEQLRSAVEKIKTRKAELDKLDAEAKEASEKIAADKQAAEQRLREAIDKLKTEKAAIEEEKKATEKQTAELRLAAEKRAEELRAENEKRAAELAGKETTLRDMAEKLKAQRAEIAAGAAVASPAATDGGAGELEARLATALEAEQSAKRELEKQQQTQDRRQKTDEDSRKTAWSAANNAHHHQLQAMIALGALGILSVLTAGLLTVESRGIGLGLLALTVLACWAVGWIYLQLRKAIDQLFGFFVKSSLANRPSAPADPAAPKPVILPAKKPLAGKTKRKPDQKNGDSEPPVPADTTEEESKANGEKPEEAKDAPKPEAPKPEEAKDAPKPEAPKPEEAKDAPKPEKAK